MKTKFKKWNICHIRIEQKDWFRKEMFDLFQPEMVRNYLQFMISGLNKELLRCIEKIWESLENLEEDKFITHSPISSDRKDI